MKLNVVSNFNPANNEAKSCFRAQTIQIWNYKLTLILNNRKWSYKLFSTSNESRMKLQVVSNFNLTNNEATSCLQAQTSQKWNYKLILILNNRKWSYKLCSTSNESGMKLQVVSNFNPASNEATSCLQAQTIQEWNYKLILILNNWKWSYKLFSTSNESGMKLHVVSNFNLANNEATSCLPAQTSEEWNYKLILILNNRKWSYKLFSTSDESRMKLQVVSNFNLANNEATSCLEAQTSQEWNYKLILIINNRK